MSTWLSHEFGATKALLVQPDFEVWECIGRAGRYCNMHHHPYHKQVLTVLQGRLKVHVLENRKVTETSFNLVTGQSFTMPAHKSHMLDFVEDCIFTETFVRIGGILSVGASVIIDTPFNCDKIRETGVDTLSDVG